MSLVLNVSEFWRYQGSEYASGFEYARILNIPEFFICQYCVTQGSEYAGVSFEYAWIFLVMSGYLLICLNMPKYA